jgi:hypothetical protein
MVWNVNQPEFAGGGMSLKFGSGPMPLESYGDQLRPLFKAKRCWMRGLIKTNFAAARQLDRSLDSPVFLLDG